MQRGAAAALHAALAGADDDTGGLRRALRRSRRREQLRAAALVLPLFLFLAACFVVPIGAMLSRGVIDTDIARILPAVTAVACELGWPRPAAGVRVRGADRRHSRGARSREPGERGDAAQLRRSGFSHAVFQHRPSIARRR